MTEPGDGLCRFAWVRNDDEMPDDAAYCHRDADGRYQLFKADTLIAVMDLCERHAENYRDGFDKVRRVGEPTGENQQRTSR